MQRHLAAVFLQLVGHAHRDTLMHAMAGALASAFDGVALVDVRHDADRVARVISADTDPARDERARRVVETLVPSSMAEGQVLHPVLHDGRVVVRGELGSGGEYLTYSLVALPVLLGGTPTAALTVIAFGRHDRFARPELAALEVVADAFAVALQTASRCEDAERQRQAMANQLDLARDMSRTLEASMGDMRDQLVALQAENAAMRALLEATPDGSPPASPTTSRRSPGTRASAAPMSGLRGRA